MQGAITTERQFSCPTMAFPPYYSIGIKKHQNHKSFQELKPQGKSD